MIESNAMNGNVCDGTNMQSPVSDSNFKAELDAAASRFSFTYEEGITLQIAMVS